MISKQKIFKKRKLLRRNKGKMKMRSEERSENVRKHSYTINSYRINFHLKSFRISFATVLEKEDIWAGIMNAISYTQSNIVLNLKIQLVQLKDAKKSYC